MHVATTLHSSGGTLVIAIYVNGAPWSCVVNVGSLMIVPLGRAESPLSCPTYKKLEMSLEIPVEGEGAFSSVGSQRSGPFRKVQLLSSFFQMDDLFPATQAWM